MLLPTKSSNLKLVLVKLQVSGNKNRLIFTLSNLSKLEPYYGALKTLNFDCNILGW